jgi:hypothetical protein
VLKPGGRFFAATNGQNHMRELFTIAGERFPRLRESKRERIELQPLSFRLENGHDYLAPYFTDITLHLFDDHLEVTDAAAFLEYALSSSEVRAAVTPGLYQQALTHLEAMITQRGAIHITKESGLFAAQRP